MATGSRIRHRVGYKEVEGAGKNKSSGVPPDSLVSLFLSLSLSLFNFPTRSLLVFLFFRF